MPGEYCWSSPYLQPKLYVEGLETVDGYALVKDDVIECSDACPSGAECLAKRIYGSELDSIVDLVAKKAVRRFAVLLPDGRSIMVEKGATLEPIPLNGFRIHLEVCEGDEVDNEDVIGYVLTGKGETRTIRSHVKGLVAYIYASPQGPPDEYIVFIAPSGEGGVRLGRHRC
ncbi:MAG: DUF2118 domain-containing protein [Crenarchaeota archaeon]|nr:DUF2118 domain-containing protein [Thermoproteota archaeon]